MVISVLTFASCTSKTNAANTEIELQQDTTIVCEYTYDMKDFDTKELAELLVKEKKAGEPNDSAFAVFFQQSGMEYGELPNERGKEGFYKTYSNRNYLKVVSDYRKDGNEKKHHSVKIYFPENDTDRLQWMIVQLRAFGMKDVKSEAVKLEGKGLKCFGMPGLLEISY